MALGLACRRVNAAPGQNNRSRRRCDAAGDAVRPVDIARRLEKTLQPTVTPKSHAAGERKGGRQQRSNVFGDLGGGIGPAIGGSECAQMPSVAVLTTMPPCSTVVRLRPTPGIDCLPARRGVMRRGMGCTLVCEACSDEPIYDVQQHLH